MRFTRELFMSLRSRVKVQHWETRAWDVITVAVMLMTALVGALWMLKQ
jgi:uncharacterized membrane protein YqjE